MYSPRSLGLIATALLLGACQVPFSGHSGRVRPLSAVPSGQIQQSTLPPPSDFDQGQFASVGVEQQDAQNPGEAEQLASIGDQAVAGPAPGGSSNLLIGRTDLLGGWTVTADGDRCQLFMSLTTWSGGYRATTKGCGSTSLQAISAWNLTGQQVSLYDNGGAQVANLYASTKTRFEGQTEKGAGISVFR
ncbi:MAG: AprI/Inh family metalloprotease inhibitor [Alphaproteobacteria bacterium]